MARKNGNQEIGIQKPVDPKLKVKALRDGYYNNERVYENDEFFLIVSSHFSHLWMEADGWKPPPPTKNQKAMIESPDHRHKFSKQAFDKVTNPGLIEEEEPVVHKPRKRGQRKVGTELKSVKPAKEESQVADEVI